MHEPQVRSSPSRSKGDSFGAFEALGDQAVAVLGDDARQRTVERHHAGLITQIH
jgi:hypothetical protein